MNKLFSRILHVYDEKDFLLYQKAKIIAFFIVAIILLTVITIIGTVAIQARIKPNIIVLEIGVLLYGIGALIMLQRGYYHVAAHGVIIATMVAVWGVMALDKAHIVSKLDSIVYILSMMTLTSIAVIRRKWVILLYGLINEVILIIYTYIVLFLPDETPWIAQSSKYDYLLDNSVSFIFITFMAYKVFSINQKALDRAGEEIRQRQISEETIREKNRELAAANEELEATNEELQATMEELEASNEEFEAINEELTTAYRNLETSEAKLRNIFRAAPIGILSVKKRAIQWASDYFFSMLGYFPDEIIGKDARVFTVDEEEYLRIGSYAARSLESNEIMELETRYRRKDGSLMDVLLSGCALNRAGDDSEFIVIAVDITGLKKMEASLVESEDRFRTMIELAPYPITMSDSSGKVIYLNRTFTELFGYTLEDLNTIDDWWQRAYPDPLYREKIQALWDRAVQESMAENRPISPQEWIVTCKNGSKRHIEFRMVPIGDISFVIMDDLTEKKITQEMMIQSEKMMTVGSLAAGMAHEINNPLGIILQGIQNTLRRINPENTRNATIAAECGTSMEALYRYMEKQNIPSYLEGIREAGTRAARIVASMLQFSRKSDSEMRPMGLNMLVEQSLEIASQDYDLKKSYDFKKIVINKNLAPDIPDIYCIETEIEQVILNLLKNAAQAMSEVRNPGYTPEIRISTAREGDHAILKVYDNGPGIEKEAIRHIFEPFYTTKSVGAGTGLGLSVSYFIITNNHGGEISADSEPGQGVTFTVKLPLALQEQGTNAH